jgi:hypothetical protein
VFCDCGYCGFCEGCSANLCGKCYDKSIAKYGKDDDMELDKCLVCQKDVISDLEVLNYVLKKYGVKRKIVEEEIRKK